MFPSSGTGAWEAALVNTLSPGDRVLAFDIGEFSRGWAEVARRLGLDVEMVPGDWRHGVDPAALEARLSQDRDHGIRAVLVVHNETSTGVTSRLPQIRGAIDTAGHPALLLVDAVSSLGSIDLRHDEWGIDVTLAGSQKGLMLPPGLGFNAISAKALAASPGARLPRAYFSWEQMLGPNAAGFFPYTPATNLLFGLREALAMLEEEGLSNVFARHQRLAAAARAAVTAWQLEIACAREDEHSPVLTAVMMPESHDADRFRAVVLERFNMSLGAGLGRVQGTRVPDRSPGRLQRPDAGGNALRRRDGTGDRRRAVPSRGHRRGAGFALARDRRQRPVNRGAALLEKRRHAFAEILDCHSTRGEVVGEASSRRRRGAMRRMASLAARMVRGALSAIVCASSRTAASSASTAASRVTSPSESASVGVDEPSGEQQILGPRRADQIDEPRAVRG